MGNELARIAADATMLGAVEYARAKGAPVDTTIAQLSALCRQACLDALPGAMRDAKEAFAVPGMEQIGEMTFLASMKLAGIAAAKSLYG